MNNSGRHMRRLQEQFANARKQGKGEVQRKLSEEEAAFTRDKLHYIVIACLYEIKTKKIGDLSEATEILREVHRASKRGQKTIFKKKIRLQDAYALKEAGVQFRPVEYRIIFDEK